MLSKRDSWPQGFPACRAAFANNGDGDDDDDDDEVAVK